jgi:DNA polymerase kappa
MLCGLQVAAYLRSRVQTKTGVTCSVGIACNHLLAKICSDVNKPNGQYELASTVEAVQQFIQVLPTRKVPGVGKVLL